MSVLSTYFNIKFLLIAEMSADKYINPHLYTIAKLYFIYLFIIHKLF